MTQKSCDTSPFMSIVDQQVIAARKAVFIAVDEYASQYEYGPRDDRMKDLETALRNYRDAIVTSNTAFHFGPASRPLANSQRPRCLVHGGTEHGLGSAMDTRRLCTNNLPDSYGRGVGECRWPENSA